MAVGDQVTIAIHVGTAAGVDRPGQIGTAVGAIDHPVGVAVARRTPRRRQADHTRAAIGAVGHAVAIAVGCRRPRSGLRVPLQDRDYR